MQVTLPLDEMTIADKLHALEDIWQDLCRTPDSIPSPPWHADVLRAREERLREGSSEFVDWADAKQKVRDAAK